MTLSQRADMIDPCSSLLHQWKRKKLMTVYGTATSLYTLARITSGHGYLSLAYILTYTLYTHIYYYILYTAISYHYKVITHLQEWT